MEATDLKKAGLKATLPRMRILQILEDAPGKHLSAEDVYKILIDHENHKVILLKETDNALTYKVFILSKDKKKYSYIWKVEKVLLDDNFKNCWMTTSVSNLKYLGDVI